MENIIMAFIGVAGALMCVYIGYLFSNITAKKTIRLQNIDKAAWDCREAFMTEYLALNPAKHALWNDLSDFLENAFDKHRIAIYRFSHYLPAQDKIGLYKAWHEYHCHEDGRSEEMVPHYEQYSLQGKTLKQKHEIKKHAKDRIDKILEFAAPKRYCIVEYIHRLICKKT